MVHKIILSFLLLTLVSCIPPDISPEERLALKQAQTRQYEVSYAIAWQATIGFLQDNYYDLSQANKESLVITASKKVSGRDNMEELPIAILKKNSIFDFRKNSIVTLTIFFDQIDETNITIRVNANASWEDGATAVYQLGSITLADTPKLTTENVIELAAYKAFHDNLGREIQRRWVAEKMRTDSKKN